MKNMLYLLFLSVFFGACDDPADNPDNTQPSLEQLGFRDGITRISDDSLAFVLFAPKKQSVSLIGDFNNWKVSDACLMHKDGDRFWIKIGNLDKNKEYVCQYLIDNTIRIADPYTRKISDPWNDKNISSSIYPNLISYPAGQTEIAMVVSTQADNYNWQVSNYTISDPSGLVIYEILIRDFTESRSIKGVKEKIPYLKTLGVNAIELMPFNEFEANDSWGYNPSFYFAPDKAYGTSADYKAFIDECHANGMAVIMDMVLNHSYGQSPMVRMYQNADGNPSADNPWYNRQSNFSNKDAQWGYDFNHESQYTQAFTDSVCSYWMSEFKIDGFRFDFTKGFSNTLHPATGDDSWGSLYDAARIKNLKRIYDEIKKRNPHAVVIFEHLAENSEEKVLAEYGILLWGNINYNMNEATMGWGDEPNGSTSKGDLSWTSYKQRTWTKPNLVSYMESHDEERIMFKNTAYGKTVNGYDVKDRTIGLKRTEAAAVILLSVPGPKMIWQFGELGYDISIESGGRLGIKPAHWEYYDNPSRKALYDVYAKMIDLHKNNPTFSTADYSIDLKDNFKTVTLRGTNETIVVMANFDVAPLTKNGVTLQPGEYKIEFNK
jgi:1,4-alpha-glucan branching enzyme